MPPPDLAASPTRESFCAVDLEKEEAVLAAAATTANNKKRRGICRKCFVIPALVLFYVASIVAFSAGFHRLGWESGHATGYQDGVQAMEPGVDYLMNHTYAKGLEQGRRESSDFVNLMYTTRDSDHAYMTTSADFDYAAGMEQGQEQCRRGDQASPRDDPQSPENKDWVFKGVYLRVAADGKTVHYNKNGWDDVWTDDGKLHYFYNPDVWSVTDHQGELPDNEGELSDDDALPPRLAKRTFPDALVGSLPKDRSPGIPDPEEKLRKLEASKWEFVKRVFRKGIRIVKNWYHSIEQKWKDTDFYKYKLHAHPRPPPIKLPKINFEDHTGMDDHMHGPRIMRVVNGLEKRTTIPVPIPAPAPTNGPYANNGNPNNYAGNGDRYITKGIPRLSKVDHNWANSQFETPKGPLANGIQPTGGTGLRLPDPYKHNNNDGPAPVQDAPLGEDLNWHLPQTTKSSEFTVTYYVPTTYPDGQVATHTVVRVGPLLQPLAQPTPAPAPQQQHAVEEEQDSVPATPTPAAVASGSDHTTTLTMGTDVYTITLPGGLKATPWPFLPSPYPSSTPSVVPALPDAEDSQETQVVEYVEEVEIVQVTEVTEVTATPNLATTEAPQASWAPEESEVVEYVIMDLYIDEDENGEFVTSTSIVGYTTVTEPIPQASEVAEEFEDDVILRVVDQNGNTVTTATGVGRVISTSTVGYPTVTEQPIAQQSQVVEHVVDVAEIAAVDQHGSAYPLVYKDLEGKLVTVTRATITVTSTTEPPHASQVVEVEFDGVTKVKVIDAVPTWPSDYPGDSSK